MSICRARLHNTSNALSLRMSGNRYVFRSAVHKLLGVLTAECCHVADATSSVAGRIKKFQSEVIKYMKDYFK